MDALELMKPNAMKTTAYGKQVEVESLRFLDWFEFDSILPKALSAFANFFLADALGAIREAIETAGFPSTIDADEGLAVFIDLGKLNELRYADPDLFTGGTEEGDGNLVLVELIVTLARCFSMEEIYNMTPEFAILCWQRIRDEIATDRNVVYYASELGYDKKYQGKSGRY